MKKVLIICGPTATGKTTLAARLAKKFKGELISADSRQVYKGMDIVTGKDKPQGVIIHGLDLVKPDQEFSAAHFVKVASTLINQISKRKKLAIIVGGTGLYLDSLINPPQTLTIKPNWSLRKKLEQKSIHYLQQQLKKLNPSKWRQMNHSDRLNPRRLIRAIEVEKSQQGPTFASQRTDLKYDAL
jgi:tRNA dimethylallyltransferase